MLCRGVEMTARVGPTDSVDQMGQRHHVTLSVAVRPRACVLCAWGVASRRVKDDHGVATYYTSRR